MSAPHLLKDFLTAVIVLFLIVNSFQALLLMLAVPELWSHWQLADDEYFHALLGTEALPPISVVAAFGRSVADPVAFATMLLGLDYPRFEVVLVSEDSDEVTLAALASAFDLYRVPPAFAVSLRTQPVRAYYRSRANPRLLCIDKQPGGRGDAMNAGVNAARYPHALAAAPDIIFERDALLRLTRPFLLDRNVAAVGGTLRLANNARVVGGRLVPGPVSGWAFGCETVEYLRNFLFQRLGWNRVASNLVFPGSTALFKREHLFSVGGFDASSPVPEVELAVRLHRFLADTGVNPSMPVIPDQVAWTLVPERMGEVGRARKRWQRGLLPALWRSRDLIGNPEYGSFGMLVLPYLWLALVVLPVLEVCGLIALAIGLVAGAVDLPFAAVYLAAGIGYGILLSVWTVILQALAFQPMERGREIVTLFLFALVESLGYRQLVAWYRASAYFSDRNTGTRNNG